MINLPEKLDMIRGDYRKLAFFCIAAGLFFSLYDVLFDLALSFLHTIFDLALSLLHASFEWIEYALEELIEHFFHTTRQQTQAIVFYLLLTAGIYASYRLGLKLTDFYRKMKIIAVSSWAKHTTRVSLFWHHQSTLEKIKLVLSGSAGIMVLTFFVFS